MKLMPCLAQSTFLVSSPLNHQLLLFSSFLYCFQYLANVTQVNFLCAHLG